MPALNQNFTIHDLDYFQVRFNVTDAVNAMNDTDARVWWGVAENSGDGESGTFLLIERSNGSWGNSIPANDSILFGSTNLVALEATYVDIIVGLKNLSSGNTTGKGGSSALTPSSGNYPVTYYHECIFSGVNSQTNSTAIATGQITVLQSLFTEQGYRA